jgi:hypothetical protein
MELSWHEKFEGLAQKGLASMLVCTPQIPHGLAPDFCCATPHEPWHNDLKLCRSYSVLLISN